jgi:hypothetical protein
MEKYLQKMMIKEGIYFKNFNYVLAKITFNDLKKLNIDISINNNGEENTINNNNGKIISQKNIDTYLALIKILKRIKLHSPNYIEIINLLAQLYMEIEDKESAITVIIFYSIKFLNYKIRCMKNYIN